MLSRNRSTCGVTPYVRATCNPDADSWVAKFIEWWIDQDTGYPIPERSGKLRWFIRTSAGTCSKMSPTCVRLKNRPAAALIFQLPFKRRSEKSVNGDPAYTSGVLIGKRKNGRYVVADVINKQMAAVDVRKTIKLTAQMAIHTRCRSCPPATAQPSAQPLPLCFRIQQWLQHRIRQGI